MFILKPTATSSAKRSTPSVSLSKKPSQKKPTAEKNTTTTTTTKSSKPTATKPAESPSTTPIAQPSKAGPRKRAQTASPSSGGLNSSSNTSTSSMSPSIVSPSAAKSPRLNGDSVGSKPPLVASSKPVSNGKAAVAGPQTAAANNNKQMKTVVKTEPTEQPVNENRAIIGILESFRTRTIKNHQSSINCRFFSL